MVSIDLRGKTALVTGASGQLGRVIARRLGEAGADVVLHAHRNLSDAEKFAGAIASAHGVRTLAAAADVTSGESVMEMKKTLEAAEMMPDILVSAAVIQYSWTDVLSQSDADFESQFRSCVMQNVYLSKAFLPRMEKRGYGRIIGINTECAAQCFAGQGAYAAGKRGMDGLLRVLAREAGPYGVTVNEIAPGWTISDRDRQRGTERAPAHERAIPLRRRGTDEEVANAVLFLASDLASYLTGVYLPVCGGSVMPGI